MSKDRTTTPERTCIVSRQSQPAKAMLRFVLGPDGHIVPDLKGRLPGRGVYVSLSSALVRQAMKKNLFARALKTPVLVPASLADDIDALMRKAALQALALANKGGAVIAGFSKLQGALNEGRLRALVHALEAGSDGTRKLDNLAQHQKSDSKIKIFQLFDTAELDMALGRSNSIHVGITSAEAGQYIIDMIERYAAYRSDPKDPHQEIVSNPDEICDKSDEISEK